MLRKIKKAVRRPLYQSEHWWSDLSTSLSDHKGAIAACSILNVLCVVIIMEIKEGCNFSKKVTECNVNLCYNRPIDSVRSL